MATLTVGTGQEFSTLAAAIAASHNGDVIQVKAGTYTNDFATINTKITIEGVGGMAHLVATAQPPNGKAILVTNTDVTLKNLEFSGATVHDGNGAGIRYQGGNLTIDNCYFHDNQDGLLAAPNPSGSITITNSEFAHNGTGSGRTHNLYVNDVGTLTIENSYFHDAVVGHEIKSRAANTIILNNRIEDGPTGTASYSIDLPNGGKALIQGNTIEQGPRSQNPAIISFGEEGGVYAGSTLTVTGNTILNDLASSSAKAVVNDTAVPAAVSNNRVWGLTAAQIAKGPATVSGTTTLTSEPALNTSHPWSTTGTVGAPGSTTGSTTGTTTAGGSTKTGTGPTGPTTTTPHPGPGTGAAITIPPGQATVTESASYATITAAAGNHTITLTGTLDTLKAIGGTETVIARAGANTITTGAGSDTVTIAGTGNQVDAGSGHNRITDTGSHNTIVIPAAGKGFDDIYGIGLSGGDQFDLRNAMKATGWNHESATLGNYLKAIAVGGGTDTELFVQPGGQSGYGIAVATLHGVGSVSLSTLLPHLRLT